MTIPEFLNRQPRWLVLFVGVFLAVLIGWGDCVTTWEWSFFAPYAIPIVLVTWTLGWRWGAGMVTFCTLTYWLANIGKNPYETNWGFMLAVFTRLFYFVILELAVAMFRARSEFDRTRIANLEMMRNLESQILRTSEGEQRRIGRDLHDSLAPHLTAVGYAAKFLADELRAHQRSEASRAEQIHQLLGEAITQTRQLSRGLFPIQADAEGLAMALEELARTTTDLTGVQVSFNESGHSKIDDDERALHLYRIAQEAVNNAVKHGRAKNVSIILNKGEETWHLTVADDGKGMTIVAKEAPGIGLRTMRYRVDTLGGELKIDSSPGEGVIVSCAVPRLAPAPQQP